MTMMTSPRAFRGVATMRADANPNALLGQLQNAFDAFKAEHTAELAALRKDVVQTEKVDRITASVADLQSAVEDMARKAAAASVGGTQGRPGDDPVYRTAFASWFKSGDDEQKLKQLQAPRAAVVGTPADGGLLAPVEWDRTIIERLKIISPFRSIANVQTVSTGGFTKLVSNGATASGWVGEIAARPTTANAQLSALSYPIGEIYANPFASQMLLDDALVDIEAWLSGEVETEFAAQEGTAFITGSGTNRPKGVMTNVAGDNHPTGAVQVVNTGAAAAITMDGLQDLIYALPSQFTQGAGFIMNRATMGAIMKLKDTTGNYLWQPSNIAGQPSTLMGFPITEMAAMANIAASALPVAFGNFRVAYRIIDRIGTRVLRDPYSQKPYVQFYTTKRVGGQIENTEALKYHRCSV